MSSVAVFGGIMAYKQAAVLLHAGPESEQCQRLIEAHKQCLRAEGFNVRATASCQHLASACMCHQHPHTTAATCRSREGAPGEGEVGGQLDPSSLAWAATCGGGRWCRRRPRMR